MSEQGEMFLTCRGCGRALAPADARSRVMSAGDKGAFDRIDSEGNRRVLLCGDCAANKTECCAICDRAFFVSDNEERVTIGADLSGSGKEICGVCYAERSLADTDCIQSYDYKPRAIMHAMREEKNPVRFFGIELELIRGDGEDTRAAVVDAAGGRRIYCKRDGSLPSGFEIVSHPHTLAAWFKTDWLGRVIRAAGAEGMRSYSDAGLHIHVSRAALTPEEWARADAFFVATSAFWRMIGRRQATTFCEWQRVVKKNGDAYRGPIADDTAESARGRKGLAMLGKSDGRRYWAVNYCNRRTVEYRFPRSTTNRNTVEATLRLLDGALDYCRAQTTAAGIIRSPACHLRDFVAQNIRREGWDHVARLICLKPSFRESLHEVQKIAADELKRREESNEKRREHRARRAG